MKKLCISLMLLCSMQAIAGTKLLRYPDIHGDQVVFTYANDLWISNTKKGSVATRLTSHPGMERFARFSPDGKQVAFTGQYNGDEQVYVIDLPGGKPRQLTWYPTKGPLPTRWGLDHQVYGWAPDGQAVLFRSDRDVHENGRLYTVPVSGGLPEVLPMPYAGSGDFAPDGKQVVYSPTIRDFRSWKRYEGGWAQNLYVFDTAANKSRQLTSHGRTERDPMWIGDRIYFVSDRDDTLELFSVPAKGDDNNAKQHTQHSSGDIKWANSDDSHQIIYEYDGELAVYDIKADKETVLDITVNDDGITRQVRQMEVGNYIDSFAIAPDAKRVAFTARGGLFSVPAKHGVTRELTAGAVAHAREAAWSADGSHVAYVSDISGEEQLYTVKQDGGSPKQLASFTRKRLYNPVWAPDSSAIAVYDHEANLWFVDRKGGKKRIAKNAYDTIRDYSWSPDSQWLAYRSATKNGYSAIYLWSRKTGKSTIVTDPLFDSANPVFSADGQLLYFVSDREFAPQLGYFEWNFVGNNAAGIFALALNKSAGNPFAPRNDSVSIDSGDDKDSSSEEGKSAVPATKVDLSGISERIARAPIENTNISGLWPVDGGLLFTKNTAYYYGRHMGAATLMRYDFEKRESKEVASEVEELVVSADGKSVLFASQGGFKLIAANGDGEANTIQTSNMRMTRKVADEWPVIFNEVWRRFRDYFYVRNMHAYDWEAIRKHYAAMLPYVSSREDLNVLMSDMIAELNVGHAYVQNGDHPAPKRPQVALMGARFELDEKNDRYRVAHIFKGHNGEQRYRSPLTEIGVDVREGDYLLAINGRTLEGATNPYDLLSNLGSQPLEITVNDKPVTKDARKVLVDPIGSESKLVYLQWVENNRRYVDEQSDGHLGYLHIPDMGGDGIYEFIKWYYPQLRKKGLVIDVRGNGGGNISSMILQRLMKKPLSFGYQAHSEWVETYPYNAFNGPMVTLISETSASDGDIFPYFFREQGLGKLIGRKTWGGIVGITSHGGLLDGGLVFVPEFGLGSKSGEWIIEGIGVEPDIDIANDPTTARDEQLDRAIAEVSKAVEAEQPVFTPRPADPDKSF
jgi:tricorn protease